MTTMTTMMVVVMLLSPLKQRYAIAGTLLASAVGGGN